MTRKAAKVVASVPVATRELRALRAVAKAADAMVTAMDYVRTFPGTPGVRDRAERKFSAQRRAVERWRKVMG